MKKSTIGFICILAVTMAACDKESAGTDYDFGDSLPPYIQITDKTPVEAIAGDTVLIDFNIRTAVQEDVTITYDVAGAVSQPGATVVLERNARIVETMLVIPDGLIAAPDTTAAITVTLKNAVGTKGQPFRVGRIGEPESESMMITVVE